MCFAQHNIFRLTKIYKIIYKIGKNLYFFNVKKSKWYLLLGQIVL